MARGVGCSRYLLEETSRHDIHFLRRLFFLSSVPFIFLEVLGNLSIGVQKRFIYPKHIFVTACRDPLSHIEMGWMDGCAQTIIFNSISTVAST